MIIPGVICAVVSRKKIILCKTNVFWEIPSGAIESQEAPATAAKRVISALTGREAQVVSHPGLISQKVLAKGEKKHYLMHLYIMKLMGTLRAHENTKWFHMEKLGGIRLAPAELEIIDKMILKTESTYYDCAIIDGVVARFDPL